MIDPISNFIAAFLSCFLLFCFGLGFDYHIYYIPCILYLGAGLQYTFMTLPLGYPAYYIFNPCYWDVNVAIATFIPLPISLLFAHLNRLFSDMTGFITYLGNL